MNKELKEWISETKLCYNTLKSIPLKKLIILGKQGGLDLNHYKTKTMLAKGLLIKLTSGMMPNEMSEWK